MTLREATLQAILDLQSKGIIHGNPEVMSRRDGLNQIVVVTVQIPEQHFRSAIIDLVYGAIIESAPRNPEIMVVAKQVEPHRKA